MSTPHPRPQAVVRLNFSHACITEVPRGTDAIKKFLLTPSKYVLAATGEITLNGSMRILKSLMTVTSHLTDVFPIRERKREYSLLIS